MRYRTLAACAALLFTGAAHASIVFSTDTSTLLTGTFSDTDGSGTVEFVPASHFALLPNLDPNIGVELVTNAFAEFGSDGIGVPNNPIENLTTSGPPANLSGMYSNDSTSTNVYFLFYDQLLNLSAPSFSGDFCFSTSSTTCATLASASSVPEPASIALVGVALAGLGYSRRKQQK